MKTPLITVSELFGASTLTIVEAATLDSCYDHVHEDYATVEQDMLQHLHNDLVTPRIQEIE